MDTISTSLTGKSMINWATASTLLVRVILMYAYDSVGTVKQISRIAGRLQYCISGKVRPFAFLYSFLQLTPPSALYHKQSVVAELGPHVRLQKRVKVAKTRRFVAGF